jgi:P-type Ca2+ transporter type 2B
MKIDQISYIEQEDPLISTFNISPKDFLDIVESYRQRKLAEELELINENGGLNSILEKIKSNASTGLSESDSFTERRIQFGDNMPRNELQLTYLQICWETLKDLTLRILIVSGIISLVIGAVLGEHPAYSWIEGFAIIAAVAVVVNVTALNDLQKQKKFNELRKVSQDSRSINLLRDGVWTPVHPRILLVGDIVKLENGVIIPADGILIESSSVEVIESAMTGENENIKKLSYKESVSRYEEYIQNNPDSVTKSTLEDKNHEIPSCVVLSGTNLAEGVGVILVIAVGKNSAEGRIMDLAEQSEDITPLMKKLNKLAENIGKAGVVCALITIISLYSRFGIEFATQKRTSWNNSNDPNQLISYFITAITVLVVAIPEGLPLAVTISLAYSIKKMQKENNLVRKMYACETMGGADVICSDKTGTLTQNKMTVSEFWALNQSFSIDSNHNSPENLQPGYFKTLKESIFANTTAFIDPVKGEQGSKSEIALISFMIDLGHSDYIEKRLKYYKKFHIFYPFSSKRKKSSILISLNEEIKRLHVKGAAEMIIKSCKSYLKFDGSINLLDSGAL